MSLTGLNVTREQKRAVVAVARAQFRRDGKRMLTTCYRLWLNRFFYKDGVDSKGRPARVPRDEYAATGVPTLRQFKHAYHSSADLIEFRRERDPRRFALNYRPLTGSATAETWGPGSRFLIDATMADIYLVSRDDRSRIVGRPVIYVVIDVWSRLIVGLYVAIEDASWTSAMMALANAACSKVAFCLEHGVEIDEAEWPAANIGARLLSDHGEVKAQQICARYAIGLIAVDEIQNLSNSHGGQSDLMSFLTSLVNVVNVPILMIGTMKALPMMTSCFRTARRGEGSGSIVYEPMPNDREWSTFVHAMFAFQWTTDLTEVSEEIAEALWDESQGIIDIAVKLFVLSQMRAIRLGSKGKSELITVGLVRAVAKDSLKLVRPMLDALRRKDWKALDNYEDLASLDAVMATELQRNWNGAAKQPDLDALSASIAAKIEGPNGEVADGLMAAALTANGLGGADVNAIMAMVTRARASADPVAALSAVGAEKSKRAHRPKSAVAPTDASDMRVAASGKDPLAGLKAAGLLDVA